MKISAFGADQSQEVINLFNKTFSDSEGQEEGKVIGRLVSELISTTDQHDLLGFIIIVDEVIAGCIFFSRLTLPSNKTAFILSPVAIATEQQGKGLGQQLIKFGVEHLKAKGVDLVFTYGDPKFYSKVGFQHINEDIVKAPLKLTYPEGWLAQSLSGEDVNAMEGICQCVKALNKQEYW